jgi:NADPH:quinone reductase-like Zn-dependent oxidoreductase
MYKDEGLKDKSHLITFSFALLDRISTILIISFDFLIQNPKFTLQFSAMVVWFITGCSSGFGSEVTGVALASGDEVIATARNASKLKHLADLGALALSLDVTAPEAEIEKVVAEDLKTYGHIDVLFNNAGQVLEGAVEEIRIVSTFNRNRTWFTQILIFST